MIIAIESPDNVGKTTLINLIKDLELPNVSFLSFPNEASESGKLTRKILSGKIDLSSTILQAAFIVNFYEQIELLRQYKNSSEFLILDRYYLSTMTYTIASAFTDNIILGLISELPYPEMTFYIEGKQRKESAEDKHDSDTQLQKKVRKEYKQLLLSLDHCIIHNDSTPQSMLEQFITGMKQFKKTNITTSQEIEELFKELDIARANSNLPKKPHAPEMLEDWLYDIRILELE